MGPKVFYRAYLICAAASEPDRDPDRSEKQRKPIGGVTIVIDNQSFEWEYRVRAGWSGRYFQCMLVALSSNIVCDPDHPKRPPELVSFDYP